MQHNTTLSNTMEQAKDKIKYDNIVKKLLSEKTMLAWIMKYCMEEYRDSSIQQIATQYINGTPEISSVPVEQDVEIITPKIQSSGTEDVSILEGTIMYDIRFHALVPTIQGTIRLIINLEAQNDYYPGYPLITRGIYYGSRMISAQSGTVFVNSHYEKIEKVYSVWICTNPPKKHENSITSYRISEETKVGKAYREKAHYDLLNIIMICLGDSKNIDNEILRLLDILLKDQTPLEDKKRQLVEEFKIPMTEEIEREVGTMCNLSDGIEQRGIQRGIERGIQRGRGYNLVSIMKKKMQKNKTLEMIADELECEVVEIQELYEWMQQKGANCDIEEIVKKFYVENGEKN